MRFNAAMFLFLSSPTVAAAAPSGFLNASFTGDGQTPSALQLYEAQTRSMEASKHLTTGTPSGDVSYSVPIPLPPALNQPAVSLAYASGAGSHSALGRGWSLSTGPSITRLTGKQATTTYWGIPQAHLLSGGGMDAVLYFDGAWKVKSNTPLPASLDYDEPTHTFALQTGGKTYVFEPAGDQVWEGSVQPYRWNLASTTDASGNTVA